MNPTAEQNAVIKNVINTYDFICEEFDATRRAMWPEFLSLKNAAELKCKENTKASNKLRLLDAGCGNGRMAHYLKDLPISYYGFDGSKKLIEQAEKWWSEEENTNLKAHFSTGNILTKKYSKPFEIVVSSAVLHHLPSPTLQQDYLKRVNSMLNKNGFLYITVWNLWQPKYAHLIDKTTHACPVTWGDSGKTRYYYAFEHEEIISALTKAGFTELEKIPCKHNFCFIAWKK